MTAAQFNSDCIDERTKLVWTRGQFLAMRQRHSCRVALYHLEKLFVEVWYHPESNVVLMVHEYERQACLAPYLEQIDISELMEKE